MGYKEKTLNQEVDQDLINKFNSFGLSIDLNIDSELEDKKENEEETSE